MLPTLTTNAFETRILSKCALQNQISTQAGNTKCTNTANANTMDEDLLIYAVQRFTQANTAETTTSQTLVATN